MTPPVDPSNNRVQVLRFRLAWGGPLVWVAHLDRMRALERAILRAGLPVAFSQGYNPRPQLVFALPSGVCVSSRAEYVDVSLGREVDAEQAAQALNSSLPKGIEVLGVTEIPVELATHVMSQVRISDYVLQRSGISSRFLPLLEREDLTVMKFSKGKERPLNIRPLILEVRAESEDRLLLRCLAGSRENLRPDLLLLALRQFAGDTEADETSIERRDLWILPEKGARALVRPIALAGETEEIVWDGE